MSVCYLSFEGCGRDHVRSQEPSEGTGRQGRGLQGLKEKKEMYYPSRAGVAETMTGKASGQGDGAGHS